MARERGAGSLAEHVYVALREQVLMGEYRPGERLHLSGLASRFGVSLGVVRQAVTRLGAGELLVATPQHGFRVRRLSEADLRDLARVRSDLEALALARALAHGDLEWESSVVAAEHVLRSAPARLETGGHAPRWIRAHARFHAVLVSACGSPTLIRLRRELFDAATLYLHWADGDRTGSEVEAHDEHERLVQAVLARDVDAATTVMRAHIANTTRVLIDAYRDSGDGLPSRGPSAPR